MAFVSAKSKDHEAEMRNRRKKKRRKGEERDEWISSSLSGGE